MFIAFLLFLALCAPLHAQDIRGMQTLFQDAPTQWIIFRDSLKEEEVGSLQKRWDHRSDIWDFELYGITGSIRMKWKDNPNTWEVKTDANTLLIQTIWQNDFSTWTLPTTTETIRYKTPYPEDREEWQTADDQDLIYFAIWTDTQGDLNSWSADCYFADDSVGVEQKIMLCFLPLWVNTFLP